MLPHFDKTPQFFLDLLNEVLPKFSPHLFPHIEGDRWVERDDYEFESILEFKKQHTQIKEKSKKELEDLQKKIYKKRFVSSGGLEYDGCRNKS